jgi:hypothetical protein
MPPGGAGCSYLYLSPALEQGLKHVRIADGEFCAGRYGHLRLQRHLMARRDGVSQIRLPEQMLSSRPIGMLDYTSF